MNKEEIVQLRLPAEEHRRIPRKDHYKLKWVTEENFLEYREDLETVIQLLHAQLEWDGIPNWDDLTQRFAAKSFCLLFYYNDKCIGWNWVNESLTYDWKTIVQPLEEGAFYLGGIFVSNLVDRPADAGLCDYNMTFAELFDAGYKVAYGYCDSWNRVALKVNYANGVKKFDFIK